MYIKSDKKNNMCITKSMNLKIQYAVFRTIIESGCS